MVEGQLPYILLIDDDPYARQSVTFFLEDEGYMIKEASNGKEGLALFRLAEPDLVILDLRMPEMDGMEVMTRIRQVNTRVPVIVISGQSRNTDLVQALRLGAWDYLFKPIEDLSILRHAVQRALEHARLRKENRRYREHLEQEVARRTQDLKVANKELHTLNARLHRVMDCTRRISGHTSVSYFVMVLMEEFRMLLGAQQGRTYLLENGGFRMVQSLEQKTYLDFLELPLPEGSVLQRVQLEGRALLIRNLAALSTCAVEGWEGYPEGSLLIFPLLSSKGRVVGLICLHHNDEGHFEEQDLEVGNILTSFSSEVLNGTRITEALRQSEERMELALSGADLGMWDWNVLTGHMLLDKRCHEMLGYRFGELEMSVDTWEAHVHPDDLEQARRTLDEHLEGRTPVFVSEYRIKAKDGSIHWIHDRGRLVERDAEGRGTRVAGTHLDITERKQAELVLKDSEAKLHNIIRNVPMPMLITREDLSIEFFNDRFLALFGDSLNQSSTLADVWQLIVVCEEANSQLSHAWTRAKERECLMVEGEWELTCLNGEQMAAELMLNSLGRLTVTTINDITRRKRLEADMMELNRDLEARVKNSTVQLEKTREALEETSRRAGMADMATGTIHNIGNILNSVNVSTEEVASRLANSKVKGLLMANDLLKAHADQLTEFLTSDPKGRMMPSYFFALGEKINGEYDMLKQEIASLNAKVDLMREVISTQQQYAKSSLEDEICVLELVENALALKQPFLDEAGVTVVRNYLKEPRGMFHKVKMTHVLVNLIKNGLEAMAGKQNKQMTLTVDMDEHGMALVQVADNGCGIRPDHMQRMFSFGFSTKEDGHGFGLHTCREWLREMGGSLEVDSGGEGAGAVFSLHFPLEMEGAEGMFSDLPRDSATLD